jgi:hypothetical protein
MVTFLTLGDGDFTYSLDLAKYLRKKVIASCAATENLQLDFERRNSRNDKTHRTSTIFSSHQPTKLIATGIDSAQELAQKYKDSPFILHQIQKQQEGTSALSVKICHGVNAISHPDDVNLHLAYDWLADGADHVIFHHPHLGTEDAALHSRFLAHLFHAVTTCWMKRNGGLFHLTLVQGQFERWQCQEAAQRHAMIMLHQASFWPPPVDESKYHCRRHQSGRSFASRRPKWESTTFTFGRQGFRGDYRLTCLPWQSDDEQDLSRRSVTTNETTLRDNAKNLLINDAIKCPFCSKTFREERSRNSHVQNKHPPAGRLCNEHGNKYILGLPASQISLYECRECTDEFGEMRTFYSHEALQAHTLAKHTGRHTDIVPDWSVAKNFVSPEKDMADISSIETVTPIMTEGDCIIETCRICGVALNGCSMSDHLLSFTPSTVRSLFQCCFCHKSFREDRARLQHENFCSSKE